MTTERKVDNPFPKSIGRFAIGQMQVHAMDDGGVHLVFADGHLVRMNRATARLLGHAIVTMAEFAEVEA